MRVFKQMNIKFKQKMSSNQEYLCYECTRKYPDFNKYQTHIKLKHRQSKALQKSSLRDQQIGDIQDKIYALLGELSEIYSEISRASQPQNLLQQQRFIGQANYSANLIVRTPYEQQINVVEQIPKNYQFKPTCLVVITKQQIDSIVNFINEELKVLCQKLSSQRDYWQFADPKDTTVDFDDESSILNVTKLIKNYQKRSIDLEMPQVTIFLIWIGRVCKPDMFRLVYEIVVSDMLCFENYQMLEKMQKEKGKKLKLWEHFLQRRKQLDIFNKDRDISKKNKEENISSDSPAHKLKCFYLNTNTNEIDISKLEKLLQYYELWVEVVLHSLIEKKRVQENSIQANKICAVSMT